MKLIKIVDFVNKKLSTPYVFILILVVTSIQLLILGDTITKTKTFAIILFGTSFLNYIYVYVAIKFIIWTERKFNISN